MLTWIQKTPNIEFETIEEAAMRMGYKYNDATETARNTFDTRFEQFSSYELDNYILQYKQRVAGTTKAREYTYWFIPLLHWIIRKQLGLTVYKNSSIDMGELVIYTSGGATSYYYPCAYRTEQQAKAAIDATIALGVIGLDYATIEEITREGVTFYTIPVIYPFYNSGFLISGSASTSEYDLPTIWSTSYIDYDPDTGYDLTLDSIDLPTQRGGGWLAYNLFNNFYILEGSLMIDILGSGFINIYKLNGQALRDIMGYLWTQDAYTNYIKVQENPISAIIRLMILPFEPSGRSIDHVRVGNCSIYPDFGTIEYLNEQFISIDCGTVSVARVHGNYLDYDGSTTADIFIPFIGWQNIKVNDIMGKTVSLKYIVDIVSGSFNALLSAGSYPLYVWNGDLSYDIPFSQSSSAEAVSARKVGLASLGAAALGSFTGSIPQVAAGAVGAIGSIATLEGWGGLMPKSNIARGGGNLSAGNYFGDAGSAVNMYLPRIILHSPIDLTPSGQKEFIGDPVYQLVQLGTLIGFTQCYHPHIEGIEATKTEIDEIEKLLSEGIIL